MHQSGHRHVRIFAARVSHVVSRRPRFFNARNDLAPDRIVWIVARYQIEKVWRDREREFVSGKQNTDAFFIAKIDMLFEVRERSDAVFQLPFPIVPKLRSNAAISGPITRSMRDELFSVTKILHLRRTQTLRPVTLVSMRAPKSAPRTHARSDFALLNGNHGADGNLREKLARGVARQTNAAVGRRVI